MKRNVGFTLIELLITMTIMVILLVLTVVSLRANQASARDEKRKSDTTAIFYQLENFYNSGSDQYSPGQYPPTLLMNSESNVRSTLWDVDARILRAPDIADTSPISLVVAATNSAAQSPDISTYIYQPLTSTGALCVNVSDGCRKFVLYYTLEATAGLQTLRSKNQ